MFCGFMQVLSRTQLFYKVNQRLVLCCVNSGNKELVEKEFSRYLDKADYNAFLYDNKDLTRHQKLQLLIDESVSLLDTVSGHDLEDTKDYQNVKRVLEEQTVERKDGKGRRARTKDDGGWAKGMLQNPTDPDATYRLKAMKGYQGYSGSFLQMTVSFVPDKKDEDPTVYPTIVVRNRVDQNIVSDSEAAAKMVETLPEQPQPRNLHADGAYVGKDLKEVAVKKNIVIRNTDLAGKSVADELADFSLDESGKITGCPMGITP